MTEAAQPDAVPADGRLRLTILGGYLGSGKTTWLRHQLHAGSFGRVHVLVNEAAETPVDDALLLGADAVTVLAGGCACCTGRGALISALRDLCNLRSVATASRLRLERIVLETSGLADPAEIVAAIQADPVLVNHIVISETIVMADALNAIAQLQSEPLGRRQIEAADRLILTKVDVADPHALNRLRATLAAVNPGCVASGSMLGETVKLAPLPFGILPYAMPTHFGDAGDTPVLVVQVKMETGMDWAAFTLWLSALLHARGDTLVRVKGTVRTPAGRLLIQAVRKVVQSPEILPEPGRGDAQTPQRTDNTIVFIGRDFRPDDLGRSLRHFARKP